jgi:predicted AlkP superfamily phosphohydrolase/phosphomutase
MSMLRRLLPTGVRDALSGCLPYDVQARLLSQKFSMATDWPRTTAYALPGYYTGCVRVNLRGREPLGIVEPGAPYDRVLDRLESDFRALTHPHTLAPVVERTVRTRDLFGAALHPALPDLCVFWRPHDRPILRVQHPSGREFRQPPHPFHRGSDHTTQGFLIGAGPSIRTLDRVADVNPLALAPTLLTLLRITPPDLMTVPPLTAWLATVPPAVRAGGRCTLK